LIAVLVAYAGWNGWQYWQRDKAQKSAALFGELELAVQAKDIDKAARIVADMEANVPGTALTEQGMLVVAKAMADAGQWDKAKAQLLTAQSRAKDAALKASIALRLAAVEMNAQNWDAALAHLQGNWPTSYVGLIEDRKGDILRAKKESAAAIQAYQASYQALPASSAYRGMVGVKLNALGVSIEQ
jgi:predicted negative regulator of RcsB-dependent stress response